MLTGMGLCIAILRFYEEIVMQKLLTEVMNHCILHGLMYRHLAVL